MAKSKIKLTSQMRKYEVTIIREIEHRAVVELEAESEDVAKQMAENMADEGGHSYWREGDTISQTFRVKDLGEGQTSVRGSAS
jgi:hypothetical protein